MKSCWSFFKSNFWNFVYLRSQKVFYLIRPKPPKDEFQFEQDQITTWIRRASLDLLPRSSDPITTGRAKLASVILYFSCGYTYITALDYTHARVGRRSKFERQTARAGSQLLHWVWVPPRDAFKRAHFSASNRTRTHPIWTLNAGTYFAFLTLRPLLGERHKAFINCWLFY